MSEISSGEIIGGLALAAIVVKESFAMVRSRLNKSGNGKAKAADLPPDFWIAKFDNLADIGERQLKLEERQTEILATMAADIAVVKDRTPR